MLPEGFSFNVGSDSVSVFDKSKAEHVFSFDPLVLECSEVDGGVSFRFASGLSKVPHKYRGMLGTKVALFRSFIKSLSGGFAAKLRLSGVGYRAVLSGNVLTLFLGFSHAIKVLVPDGLNVVVEKDEIKVSGTDGSMVMRFCVAIRQFRKPEVYKGAGVYINDETILLKQGKKK